MPLRTERHTAVAPDAQEDTRDDQTLVAVVHKDQLHQGQVKDGIHPGRVSLGWLRFGKNSEHWVEVDPETGKKVTPTQAAKAAAAVAGQEG
jgi:hypothetical protein